MEDAAPSFEVQGQEVRLPARVRDAESLTATYLVDAAAARSLLPGPELELPELLPGRALLSLACIDYRDNDLGDYQEVSIALFVRERGAPRGLPWLGTLVDLLRSRLGTWIHWLPVTQEFTREAGCRIWGFPKTLAEIGFRDRDALRECTLGADGRSVLSLAVPSGGTRRIPDAEMATYTWIEGVPHRTRFVSGAEGVGIHLGGAELHVGEHPEADRLRALGLPRRALFCAHMQHMHGRFEAPEKL